jgi:formate hydrogenlyase subunit 3/multisubunit Na+/H+ antiporter MnhD subunit
METGHVADQASPSMKTAKPRQVGAWIVLAVLVAFLCAAIAFMVVGWGPGEGERGQEMSTAGYVAMVLGIIVTLALGTGLMALVFYSNREGHDQDSDLKRDE